MLTSYLKYKPGGRQFFSFFGIVLLFIVVQSILVVPLMSKSFGISIDELEKILQGELQHPSARLILVSLQAIQFFALFLLPSLLFAYFADPDPQQFLGLSHFPKPHYFLKALVLVVLGTYAIGLLGYINKQIPMPDSIIKMEAKQNAAVETLAIARSIPELILSIVLVGVFAGIGEEIFFRGVVQKILIKWTRSPWTGIIITSIFFSAFHLQFSGFLPRMGLGIVLGALYWYSGSLWPGILFHFVHNTALVFLSYRNPKILQQDNAIDMNILPTIIMGVLSTVAVIYMVWLMKKQSTTRFDKVYPTEPDFFD